jgi:hypothetical protein
MYVRDRIAQTTNSAGTGNLQIDGTINGFRTFAGTLPAASDKLFAVLVKDGDAWELFESYLIAGSPASLFRGALISSSTGSQINLSNATDKPIYLVEPAEGFGPMGGRSSFALTAGTAPDYTAVFPAPIRALKNGTRCLVKIHAVNPSSPATFAPDGLAAKPIRVGRPLRTIAPNRLPANLFVELEFSESDDCWIVLSALPNVTKTISPTTYTLLEEDHQQALIFTSATGCAVTVPQSTGQFAAPFDWNYIIDAAAGTVTYTPATSTINGAASLAVTAGQSGTGRATGGNYVATVTGAKQATVVAPLAGLIGANNAATPNSQFDIACLKLLLEDASGNVRGVAVSATVDITLSGISGLDTGSEANSTWYALWAVDRTTPLVAAAVTADASTDKITLAAHGLPANTPVFVGGGGAPGGLTAGTIYYVKSPGTNDLQVAATPGGSAINITSTGTTVTLSTAPGMIFSLSNTAPTMPSGYTYKQYVGRVYNDGSGNLRVTRIRGRKHTQAAVAVLTHGVASGANTWSSGLSISSAVPPDAVSVGGNFGNDTTTSDYWAMAVSGNAAGNGHKLIATANGTANQLLSRFSRGGSFSDIPLDAAQTIYWAGLSTSAYAGIDITEFTI